VALTLLAIGLAPWCLRRGQLPYGLAMFTLLLGAYLLWHQAAGWILQQPLAEAPLPLSWLAVLLFLGLYLLQAVILAHPQGAVAQRLYPLAFAGFYLDEHFTRLTFRLWPVRPPQHLPSPYGERP
jgi:NAD(P)H-quinone oxidoreductase subunit 5